MTHTYQSNNERYTIEPKQARGTTFYVLTWHSSTLGPKRLTSLGTAANEGHGIPYFQDAVYGMRRHARSMGLEAPTELA